MIGLLALVFIIDVLKITNCILNDHIYFYIIIIMVIEMHAAVAILLMLSVSKNIITLYLRFLFIVLLYSQNKSMLIMFIPVYDNQVLVYQTNFYDDVIRLCSDCWGCSGCSCQSRYSGKTTCFTKCCFS